MKCGNWPSSCVEGNVSYVTNTDRRKVKRVFRNQWKVLMKRSRRRRGYHRLRNPLLPQSPHHHLQRLLPHSVRVLSSSENPSYAVSLKRRLPDRRVRLGPQDDVPEVAASRVLRPPVVVVRRLQALVGGMKIVPGDVLHLFVPLRGRTTARDRGLRKGFATVIGIGIAIEIEIVIGVVTVVNLPEPTVAARVVVTIDEDRARTLGIAVGRVLEHADLGQSRGANPVPVTIAGIDHLR